MRLSGPALRLAGGGVPRPALCQCQVAPGTKGRKPGTLAILRHLRIEPTPVGQVGFQELLSLALASRTAGRRKHGQVLGPHSLCTPCVAPDEANLDKYIIRQLKMVGPTAAGTGLGSQRLINALTGQVGTSSYSSGYPTNQACSITSGLPVTRELLRYTHPYVSAPSYRCAYVYYIHC